MCPFLAFFLVLSLTDISNCDIALRIFRNTEENYTPVTSDVQEKAGSNFTLSCELWSSDPDNTLIDDQISWGKASPELSFKTKLDLESLAKKKSKLLYSLIKQSDVNKAIKSFSPLRIEDEGTYFCTSFKYMLFEIVYIFVKDDNRQRQNYSLLTDVNLESMFCNEFLCQSSGACIKKHYVCDGKPDCLDGSDETVKECNGNPCKDKIPCDDGRCIPNSWCCDRHHDPSCTVVIRPSCCQSLSEPYDDMEYGYVPYNITQAKPNGTRYLFISLCILATFFSIVLMLLILSKVFIFAKKTTCNYPRNLLQLEELTARQSHGQPSSSPFRGNILRDSYRNRLILSNVRYAGNCNDVLDGNNEVSDPLLSLRGHNRPVCHTYVHQDQPPSYAEVVQNQSGMGEPPPPYTSRELLNLGDEPSHNRQ